MLKDNPHDGKDDDWRRSRHKLGGHHPFRSTWDNYHKEQTIVPPAEQDDTPRPALPSQPCPAMTHTPLAIEDLLPHHVTINLHSSMAGRSVCATSLNLQMTYLSRHSPAAGAPHPLITPSLSKLMAVPSLQHTTSVSVVKVQINVNSVLTTLTPQDCLLHGEETIVQHSQKYPPVSTAILLYSGQR